MTEWRTIRLERRGTRARVVLDRPEVRNAFDDVMIRELRECFAALATDPGVRAVVLAANGPAFCGGADLNWMRRVVSYGREESYADSLALADLLREMYELPRPMLALVRGPAIGGGVGLVAVCDIAVASADAAFSLAEVKVGLVPACISPYVLKRMGERHAREYFLTGKRLTAEEALACGLVNRVAEPARLEATAEEYLAQFEEGGPRALATCKHLLRSVPDLTLEEAGPATARIITELRLGEEGQEGMLSFLEKRKPSWRRPGREAE